MGLSETVRFHAKTDVGRVRDLNEDNFLVDRRLHFFIVADGMGGHAAGEVASALAVRLIHEEVKKRADFIRSYGAGLVGRDGVREIQSILESAILKACSRIHEEAKADSAKRGMGTTLSSLLITGSHGFVAHVGDSRIYLQRGGRIQQLTEDHTVYNELIKRGRLTKEQIEKVAQKNAITRAVGVYERVDVDTLMLELLPGDQFLLASDGLHGYINHTAELEPYMDEADGEVAVSELVDLANKKGGKDNITCVLVRVGSQDDDGALARRHAQKREALAGMPLFSRLQERELLRIMEVAELLEYEPGEDVMREGDRGDQLFIVVEGLLQILRGDQLLSEVGPGEHFGEMALIRSMPRSATVRAIEKSELLAIRRADFFAILRKEYELAVKLLWQFLGVLADRLDQTSRDLSTAKEELAAEDISDAIADEDSEEARNSRLPEGSETADALAQTLESPALMQALAGAPASEAVPRSVAPRSVTVTEKRRPEPATASTAPAAASPASARGDGADGGPNSEKASRRRGDRPSSPDGVEAQKAPGGQLEGAD
jgi:serine/threonine protein phosphatase PrpC/CRP-like cAMP-binding protein